jgi:chromosome segregation ATPase
VHSPEKLVQIIAELNGSITNERINLGNLERKSRELQQRSDYLAGLEEELKKCLHVLGELDSLIRTRDELARQVRDCQDMSNRQQSVLREVELRHNQVSRQVASSQEKLTRLHSQQQDKREQVQQRLRCLRQEYSTLTEERTKLAAKMDQTDRLIKDMEAKVTIHSVCISDNRSMTLNGHMIQKCSIYGQTASPSNPK